MGATERDTILYMCYVYVLMCNDGKCYIGYTADLEDRVKRHMAGEVFSTKGRLPAQLIFYEAFSHRADAKRREDTSKLQLVRKRFLSYYADTIKIDNYCGGFLIPKCNPKLV